MSQFQRALDAAAHEAARLDDKTTAHVVSTFKVGLVFVGIAALLFAASVYGLNTARTNAGQGVGWFASAITGLILAGCLWSAVDAGLELRRRLRDGR